MRVGGAEGGKALLSPEPFLVGKPKVEFGIEAKSRNQILLADELPGGRLEVLAKFSEAGFLKAESRRHVVAAEGVVQSRATPERLDERESLDASTASFDCSGVVKSDDQGRSVPAS